jgi:hypothetical protein
MNLFKYFSGEKRKTDLFLSGNLSLTPPKYFNDPWDFVPIHEPFTPDKIQEHHGFSSPPSFAESLNEESSREQLSREMQNEINRCCGILCLCESPFVHLMWSHYGDSYKGFVAEFECGPVEENEIDTPFGRAVKVQYEKELPKLNAAHSNHYDILRVKHPDWGYEQEWRVFRALAEASNHPTEPNRKVCAYRPKELLRIILGPKEEEYQKGLIEKLRHPDYQHVRLERLVIKNTTRELTTEPILDRS